MLSFLQQKGIQPVKKSVTVLLKRYLPCIPCLTCSDSKKGKFKRRPTVVHTTWLGGVVRALDSRRAGREFEPLHCRATTLGKLFTPMCLCSPSSIIWYLVNVRVICLGAACSCRVWAQWSRGYCWSGPAVILDYEVPLYKYQNFNLFTLLGKH